jgi:hypothetical protein
VLYITLTHFESAENVDRVTWLPPAASYISYYRSYNFTAYEFDISETEFKRWIWLDVKPITQPVKIYRYSHRIRTNSDFGLNPSLAELEEWEATYRATVSDGLYYNDRRSSGGGVTVAFDRTKDRAYFQTNPR